MLPCSVRRVASAAPQSPNLSTFGSAVTRAAAATVGLVYRPHPQQQRRYSSSKPSRDNGSQGPPVRQSVQPSATESKISKNKAPETKTGETKSAKRKKSAKNNSLPSVPSTQHIHQSSLALSTFFSLHRPISVTNSVPHIINDDVFAAMFGPRTRAQQIAEAEETITRAVQSLEQPTLSKLGLGQDSDMTESIQKLELRHSDGSETSIDLQLKGMSGQFLPFSPPPVPQPESAAGSSEAAAEPVEVDTSVEEEPRTRIFKAIFTIEESTDADGQVKFMAHSPELVEEQHEHEPEPRSFLARMALRQLKHEEALKRRDSGNRTMMLISVKRQRKLKMKKKKYKKLMKRTRNLRRKLDRT